MKVNRLLFACLCAALALSMLSFPVMTAKADGVVSLTAFGAAYTEDFNTLATAGTSNVVPLGWAFYETDDNADLFYTAGTGSGNAGDTYSFGAIGSTERAFGGLLSGSLVPLNGAQFSNNAGGTISSLSIAYTGEQWRIGSITLGRSPDRLDFQYSLDATSLITGTWTDVDSLDFSSPVISGTIGALNGNAAANRTAISAEISDIAIPNGATFWIRWADYNVTSSDDGLSVDDFSLVAQGVPDPTDAAPLVISTVPADGAVDVPRDSDLSVAFSEAVNLAESWYSLTCSVSGDHSAALSGEGAAYLLNPDVDFAYDETCTLSVYAAGVSDQDGQDPPDTMESDFSMSFTTMVDVCTLDYTHTYQIQGSGPAAAITGGVTTQGVVVSDHEGASPMLRGFYLQDLTGDGDAATSDGIFVFNGNNNVVNLGDVVRITGNISEYQGQTQVSASSIVNCGSGSVEPVDVTLPFASSTDAERYEGMLVRLPQTLYVTEMYQLGRFGQVTLSVDGRLAQPTNVVLPGVDAQALQAQNLLKTILVDDSTQAQNPDPIAFGRSGQPLSAANTLRGGDTATGIVGVMTYTWGGNSASPNAYRVRPINSLGGSINFEPANPRPEVAPALSGRLRVAGMNVLNYFNSFTGCTNGVGGAATDCRGAETQVEFDRQWPKTVAAIIGTNAVVVGLTEIENDGYGADSAIQTLVNQLNAAAGAGTFAFIDADAGTGQVNALGLDAIKVALVYKTARVMPVGVTAALNSEEFVNGGDASLRNRPALAQAFEEIGSGARFVVAVNHLKSKGSACEAPDAGDGQGNCNAVRTNAANALTTWLAEDPTGINDPDALIIGDLNSYAMEDPIRAIEAAGYTNLVKQFGGDAAYSYVFDGQWGYLDHALGSNSLASQVTGVTDWHINSDEPSVLDYNVNYKSAGQLVSLFASDQFRMADHDPVLVDLNLKRTANRDFVVGDGWIQSPAGAYATKPEAGGKAMFEFVLRYKKGRITPSGLFKFDFKAAKMSFAATRYEWLVFDQDHKVARAKGWGTINRKGRYQFLLTAVDGKHKNPDYLRVQIWAEDGTLVYDNGTAQEVDRGCIMIKTLRHIH